MNKKLLSSSCYNSYMHIEILFHTRMSNTFYFYFAGTSGSEHSMNHACAIATPCAVHLQQFYVVDAAKYCSAVRQ